MKPSIPFTPAILNATIKTVYILPWHVKPFDIITYFEIKTIFGETINQLESVFLGTFGKSFYLNKNDRDLFRRLYPYMYEKLNNAYGRKGTIVLLKALDTFRNYNMHARSDTYLDSIEDLVKLAKLLPNYSRRIVYYKGNELTFAGMLTIILLLSSELMIKYLYKNHMWKNFIEHLRIFGPNYINENEFVEKLVKLSKADFELSIREDDNEDEDIISIIFGRFKNKVTVNGEKFKYFSRDSEDTSEYWCSGEIHKTSNAIVIKINKGSYLPEFFSEDYFLTIRDYKSFSENCRTLPPFTFITFLYHLGIDIYKSDSIPKEKKALLSKLNHPKFYVDKNINTLLIPTRIADLRLSSQIVAAGLNYCFLKLENELYSKFHLDFSGYTTLKGALGPFCFNPSLLDKIISMRNFFAHHYILGDNVKYGKRQFRKIDLTFVFKTMNDFILTMERKDPEHAEYLRKNFFYKIIMNLVYMKYYDSYNYTKQLLTTDDLKKLLDAMERAKLRMNSSCFTYDLENMTPLFVRKNDVAFNYYDNGRKTFTRIYKSIITSENNIILKNGRDTGLKEIIIHTFTEPNLNDYFKYDTFGKVDEKIGGLIVKRKFVLK